MPDSAFLFIHAITSVHPGSGTALGHVDLPIQRERHTDWPMIPGSSLKGVLRDALGAADRLSEEERLAVFGPDQRSAHEHAGAIALTDARILGFPVRSLAGVFAWVTCPAVLGRLRRDAAAAGIAMPGGPEAPATAPGQALAPDGSPLLIENQHLLLEDLEFQRTGKPGSEIDWIAGRAIADEATAKRFARHAVVLSDDDFSHFARNATEVTARIGLDHERKTVKDGALFYEEFLPPESLLYALLIAGPSRRKTVSMTSADVLRRVKDTIPPMLQIGADETIGRGFCAVRIAP